MELTDATERKTGKALEKDKKILAMQHTRSSTNTLPFFFPFGFCTPMGVTMFSSGIPRSFSL